jgi:hypothetical protein
LESQNFDQTESLNFFDDLKLESLNQEEEKKHEIPLGSDSDEEMIN